MFSDAKQLGFRTLEGLNSESGKLIMMIKEERGISFKIAGRKENYSIEYQDIINIVYREHTEVETKSKSIVGRALVGGALTGGIGAIIGGMTGIKDKKKTQKMYVIEIEYIVRGVKETILLEDRVKIGTKKFIDSICENITTSKRNVKQNTNVESKVNNEINIVEQLEQLSKLKEQGILSEEEFQKGKNKILN